MIPIATFLGACWIVLECFLFGLVFAYLANGLAELAAKWWIGQRSPRRLLRSLFLWPWEGQW